MLRSPMNRILTIWRQMTGAERAVAAAVALVLAVTVVAGAFALLKRPVDVSNPDAPPAVERHRWRRQRHRLQRRHRRDRFDR